MSRAAAATVLVAAVRGSPLLTSAPAGAAACGGATGVTVVVEPHDLGGATDVGCVAGGGGDTASSLFPAAGHPLTYAQRQPGYVCRVDGVPASDPCVNTSPASAYWALYWTDGTSGTWNYSTLGVGSLRVPDGGSVAFVWDDQSGDVRPSTAAAVHPAATPSTAPTASPTRPGTQPGGTRPTRAPGGTAASAAPSGAATSASATPSASGSTSGSADASPGRPGRSGSPDAAGSSTDPDVSATADPAEASPAPADAAPATSDDGGLPGWVPVGLVVALGAASAVVLLRRGRNGS